MTEDGGLGFCHEALPDLLPWGYHGPLVVALDSNILIDLQQHGSALMNDEVPDVDAKYAADLNGLADLLNLWLLRDIRFVVTPRALTDAKKNTERLTVGQWPAVEAVAASLAFQFGDWNAKPPSALGKLRALGGESGLPNGADRDLVLEAQAIHAHVFLTRDGRVIRQVRLTGPRLVVAAPRSLGLTLAGAGVEPFAGGVCGRNDCPYGDWQMPAPDIGKWGPLLGLFD